VTFSASELKAVLDAAIAEALAAHEAKPPANRLVDDKTEQQLRTEVAVCRAFKKAGYGEVKPREDVQTYNRWLAEGWKVKTGERATRIKQFRLFHRSQCEFVGLPSKAEQQAEADAAVAAHAATAAKPGIVARLKAKATSTAPAQSSLPV
jgi:hypothetical protein